MSYIIFNTSSGDPLRILQSGCWKDAEYHTAAAAKAALTRLSKTDKVDPTKFSILPKQEWDSKHNVMVERTNIMSGNKYMEKKYTPSYCSPSSEAYWTM